MPLLRECTIRTNTGFVWGSGGARGSLSFLLPLPCLRLTFHACAPPPRFDMVETENTIHACTLLRWQQRRKHPQCATRPCVRAMPTRGRERGVFPDICRTKPRENRRGWLFEECAIYLRLLSLSLWEEIDRRQGEVKEGSFVALSFIFRFEQFSHLISGLPYGRRVRWRIRPRFLRVYNILV